MKSRILANEKHIAANTADIGTLQDDVEQNTKDIAGLKTGKKDMQTAKSDPTANGTTITAIDTISQNAQGVITATKKTIRSATTSQTGVVKLNNTLTSTSTTEALTAAMGNSIYNNAAIFVNGLGADYVINTSDFKRFGIYHVASFDKSCSPNIAVYNESIDTGDWTLHTLYAGDQNWTVFFCVTPRRNDLFLGFCWNGGFKGWRAVVLK